jgi:CheY-like chemotaxis protein
MIRIGRRLKQKSCLDIKRRRALNVKQVLLLDDNPAQLSIREMVLRKGGMESHVATNAPSALAFLRSDLGQQKIGAVVTDHIMPGMDGAQFVRELRGFSPDIPVIVISGLAEAEEEYAGLKVVFRTKPCEPEDLIALVKSTLDGTGSRKSA